MFCFLSGSSIKACLETGRHILALEDDPLIFKAMIAPFAPITASIPKSKGRVITPPSDQPPTKKPKRNRFTSCV